MIFLLIDSILICTTGFRERFGLFEQENELINSANKIKIADSLKFI